MGVQFLKLHQTVFERDVFKKSLEAGLVRRVENKNVKAMLAQGEQRKDGIWVGPDWTQYDYIITPLGDSCLREEQIARDGDPSYYKYFDRSLTGENGLNKYAPLPNYIKKNGKNA